MKKHIALGLCLLASTAVHAHTNSIQKAIAASERAIKRGSANVHLVAAITALKGALNNIQETQANLNALKGRLVKISAAIDAGVIDLGDQITALGVIAGSEEQPEVVAPVAAPVAPAPVAPAPVAPAAPAVVDADDHDHDAAN